MGKRKRGLKFQENSVTDEGHSENGNGTPPWALEVPLILQRIMSYLSLPDILHNCSSVNKFWCHEARTFLRDKRTCTLCTALIKSSGDEKVMDNLMNSSVIPFNKISVYCPKEFGRGAKPHMVRLEQQILQLIEMMKLKSLYIYEDESDPVCNRRMPRNIIEKALRKKNGTIEEISVCFMPHRNSLLFGHTEITDDFCSFLKDLFTSENFCLPVLHTLVFHREQRVWPGLLESCVLPIITTAPKLQNVFLTLPLIKPALQVVSSALPEKYAKFLKRFRLNIYVHGQEEWSRILTNTELECKHLELVLHSRWRNFEHRLPMILELLGPFLVRNRNSITLLITDVPTILILHQNGLLGLFPSVKHLGIKAERLGAERLGAEQREELLPVVSNFSLSFPALLSVAIEGQHVFHPLLTLQFPIIMDPISSGETPVQQKRDSICTGLKELIFRECYNPTLAETWATMFPDVQHLVVSAAPEVTEMDLSHIWRCWPSLLSLQVTYHRMNAVNFISTVCGLSQAEVKMLQKKSVEQLRRVMVVPTGPSITGMKSLSQFHVYIVSEKAYWKKMKCPVPKMSQEVAFGKMKNLKVQFQYTPKYWLATGNELSG